MRRKLVALAFALAAVAAAQGLIATPRAEAGKCSNVVCCPSGCFCCPAPCLVVCQP